MPAQGGEEARAHLEADRVHEEDEPQLAHELAGALLDVDAEVAEREAHEEDAGDAEADPAQPHGAQGEAEGGHEGQDEDRPRRGRPVEERQAHSRITARSHGPRVRRSPAATGFCDRSSVPGACAYANDCGSPEKLR